MIDCIGVKAVSAILQLYKVRYEGYYLIPTTAENIQGFIKRNSFMRYFQPVSKDFYYIPHLCYQF